MIDPEIDPFPDPFGSLDSEDLEILAAGVGSVAPAPEPTSWRVVEDRPLADPVPVIEHAPVEDSEETLREWRAALRTFRRWGGRPIGPRGNRTPTPCGTGS